MVHILKKLADWIIDEEMGSSTDCTISDEIIDEWLETIENHKKKSEKYHKKDSEQYDMLVELEKKVRQIKEIREKKCHKIN